ncbi:MAG TPA: NAD(P)-dependent oxidoreductase [Anaerolineae bacterium]|nr:NAD(P)-dependent oxidoreductase [Anaerolineae bacterium]
MKLLVTGGSGFIGTNFIDMALTQGIEVLNLDIYPPQKDSHLPYWQQCDIMDIDSCEHYFRYFQPTHVVHLAGKTDTDSSELGDYDVNTTGTENILSCIKSVRTVERVIITSTQFVFAPPGVPEHDEHFNPIGAYGMSKAISEKATRSAGLNCVWTITRPTNIWGPWHARYAGEFWLVLKKRLYFHPGGSQVIRTYGYVKNVSHQMLQIFESKPHVVDKKVIYVGDPPIPLIDWANGFSLAITGRPVRVVPRWILRAIAIMGTALNAVGIKLPITLSRFRSMTEDYYTPMEATIAMFGAPKYSLEEGINETVDWLNYYWNDNSARI